MGGLLGGFNAFFSIESGYSTRIFYMSLFIVTILYSVIALVAPLITPVCPTPSGGEWPNPSFHYDPCWEVRYLALLGMTSWEADMSRRIVMAILIGSVIGFERRRADRPAGIRTMAMVCLGACVFTIGSIFAFVDGTMGWDASRVSAAIPSGVGFLGAASIWKGTKTVPGGESVPEVHGLTTATSIWLAAAIGILIGGALYVPAAFTTAIGVVYLRFAPRLTQSEANTADAEGDAMEAAAPLLPNATPIQPSPGPPLTPGMGRARSASGSKSQLLKQASIHA
jgi:uncharacterized membrane protein YhiD involved in acid resistance